MGNSVGTKILDVLKQDFNKICYVSLKRSACKRVHVNGKIFRLPGAKWHNMKMRIFNIGEIDCA